MSEPRVPADLLATVSRDLRPTVHLEVAFTGLGKTGGDDGHSGIHRRCVLSDAHVGDRERQWYRTSHALDDGFHVVAQVAPRAGVESQSQV